MSQEYVLAIDQGTTGTRASLINKDGEMRAHSYGELPQCFPRTGTNMGTPYKSLRTKEHMEDTWETKHGRDL